MSSARRLRQCNASDLKASWEWNHDGSIGKIKNTAQSEEPREHLLGMR